MTALTQHHEIHEGHGEETVIHRAEDPESALKDTEVKLKLTFSLFNLLGQYVGATLWSQDMAASAQKHAGPWTGARHSPVHSVLVAPENTDCLPVLLTTIKILSTHL